MAKNKPKTKKASKAKKEAPQKNLKDIKKKKIKQKKAVAKVKEEPKAKKRINQRTKEIEKGLKSIYQDFSGRMPNMTKIEHNRKNRTVTLIIFFIIALALIFIVSFLGFLIFQPDPSYTGSRINLEIKGPFTAISGEDIDYEIKLTNSEDINLSQCLLTVYLPYGFIFSQSNIAAQENETTEEYSNIKTWQINDLYSNTEKTIEISGKLIGQIDGKQTISATLSYTPVNFSSEFQKTIAFNTEIIDSLIDLEIKIPSQLAHEEEDEFILNISNQSEEVDLNNVEIELNYPDQFIFLESQINDNEQEGEIVEEEQAEEEDILTQKTWNIETLPANTQKNIIFKGKFDIEETQDFSFNIKVKLKGPADEFFIQQEKTTSIEVIKGELIANLIIAGSNQNRSVNFGDSLNYLINIQNKSKNTLGDIKIRAVMDSPFLDWNTLDDSNNGVRDGHQILWTKDQIQELGVLFPEDEIEINLQIDLKPYIKSSRYNDEDYQVKSFFETQINAIDNDATEIVIESNSIINEINSNTEMTIEGRYFDDDNLTVGSGPLPPIVGQKTTYKIYWHLTNELHEITEINISSDLPDYVNFEGNETLSTGEMYIKDKELVWSIGRIPTSVEKATAEFEISIQPTAKDIDKILTLLSEINLQAKDSITNGKIDINYQGITTNLDSDPLAKGKGLVEDE